MKCLYCNLNLEQALLAGVEVDYCPSCYGLWFEENELQWAKDEKAKIDGILCAVGKYASNPRCENLKCTGDYKE